MLKKTLYILLALLLPMMAQGAIKKNRQQIVEKIVHDTIFVEIVENEYQHIGDTLVLKGDTTELPKYLTIVWGEDTLFYKGLAPDPVEALDGIPASDLYSDMWQNSRVNPYNTPIDSIKGNVQIDLRGFRLPHPGAVTSPYGPRRNRYHYGTDLRVAVGDSIRSAWDGVVRIVGWDPRGYGRFVVIRHDNGLETVYGHLSMPLFDENERIYAGEVLGLGGNTGRSTGPHLHFEMRYLGNAFNTARVIDYEHGCLREFADSTYTISQAATWPERAEIKAMKAAKYHTIRDGDTLSGIAKRYHTTIAQLCRLNGIKQNTIIRAGKKLRVR